MFGCTLFFAFYCTSAVLCDSLLLVLLTVLVVTAAVCLQL